MGQAISGSKELKSFTNNEIMWFEIPIKFYPRMYNTYCSLHVSSLERVA